MHFEEHKYVTGYKKITTGSTWRVSFLKIVKIGPAPK